MIEAGFLPCTGELTAPDHGSYTAPFPLRPLMAYNLDIEVDPLNDSPPDKAILPLFRRKFRTSKFPSVVELIAELKGRRVKHRALESQIGSLPPGTPSTPGGVPVGTATDREIQDALTAAGEQALPAPSETGITIYWAKRAGASTYSPHVIMVDAAEPLWRTRLEPRLETVTGQQNPPDPAFKRVVPQTVPALEVIEQGGSAIARFVRSTSGTRTLAFVSDAFTPAAGGTVVTLAAQRPASALFGITSQTTEIIGLRLVASAPWEDDDE